MPWIDVCPVEELPPGTRKLIERGLDTVGVYNCDGAYRAIEDRCSHDDGPLREGDWEPDGGVGGREGGVAVPPRPGARCARKGARPLTLPAFQPVATFPVEVVGGIVR